MCSSAYAYYNGLLFRTATYQGINKILNAPRIGNRDLQPLQPIIFYLIEISLLVIDWHFEVNVTLVRLSDV